MHANSRPGILGDEVYEQLKEAGDLSDEQVESLGLLKGEWMTLGEEARRTANAMAQAAGEADMYGLDALWEVLANTSNEMRQLADDFDAGTIDGETFRTKLDELQRSARTAFDTLDDADKVNFSGVISEVERLGGVVAAVAGKVSQLYGWLKAAAGMGDSVALEDDRGAASLARTIRIAFEAGETGSLWRLEGPLRASIRADLCLQGWTWKHADEVARDVVAAAHRRVGASRPSWNEGQLEWTIEVGSLIQRTRCVRCHKPLPEGHIKFCSHHCNTVYHSRLNYRHQMTAERVAETVARLI
jgi:hypothetical protein